MSLSVKGLAGAGAIAWGGCYFLVGIANMVWSTYGTAWLDLAASIYPGYEPTGGFGSVVVLTLYALLDGAVAGAIFAWLYNLFAGDTRAEAPRP